MKKLEIRKYRCLYFITTQLRVINTLISQVKLKNVAYNIVLSWIYVYRSRKGFRTFYYNFQRWGLPGFWKNLQKISKFCLTKMVTRKFDTWTC